MHVKVLQQEKLILKTFRMYYIVCEQLPVTKKCFIFEVSVGKRTPCPNASARDSQGWIVLIYYHTL